MFKTFFGVLSAFSLQHVHMSIPFHSVIFLGCLPVFLTFSHSNFFLCWSQWPQCRSAATWLLGSRVRIPLWGMDVCLLCLCVVLSCVGRGLCCGLITHPEESYHVSNCMIAQTLWLRKTAAVRKLLNKKKFFHDLCLLFSPSVLVKSPIFAAITILISIPIY
jgi:hypothetical protein